jgi:hypothetical protein
MALAKARFLDLAVHRTICRAILSGQTGDVTLQAGWTVFIMDAIEE